jgi:lipopolysaccharide transport system ATP-binding protein
MSDIAIRVENLSKLYRIGTAGRPRYETLYDKIAGAGGRLLDRLRRPLVTHSAIHIPQSEIGNPQSDYIWALKDVSFEVKRGEVVGIIGRNGAGKSTLLKILSRITEPTEGRAYVYGRVGSLLEVGTGFHPELTGRENIYLNGAILGMRKAEIDRKFDEIVAFAEIEKFIDTPVKFYSSGMYVRLAFAVAAHLDPEILLVDEVLAVGDAAFQKKCLGKMGEVAGEGRTVLFVSHNMGAIRSLCEKSLLLHQGRVAEFDITDHVLERYTASIYSPNHHSEKSRSSKYFRSLRVVNERGSAVNQFLIGSRLRFEIHLENLNDLVIPIISLFICDEWGSRLIMLGSQVQDRVEIPRAKSVGLTVETEEIMLLPGRYVVDIGIGDGGRVVEYINNVLEIEINSRDLFGTGRLPNRKQGVIAQRARWTVRDYF